MSAAVHESFGVRIRKPGSPIHLALVRIVFAIHLLTVLISPVIPLIDTVHGRAHPLARTYFPAALERLCTPAVVQVCVHIGAASAVLVALGLLTRVALPVLLAMFLVTQQYYFRVTVFHDDWLYFPFYLLVLCFAPCADALAIDARLFRRKENTAPRDPQSYRWPVELMIAWFSLIYTAAGIAKLFPLRKGLLWLSGASTQQFAVEFLFDSPIYWLRGRTLFDYTMRWPFTIASVLTVIVELGAATLLFTRRFDVFVLGAILGMHAAIHAFGIPAFFQIALVSCVLFVSPEAFPPASKLAGSTLEAASLRSGAGDRALDA